MLDAKWIGLIVGGVVVVALAWCAKRRRDIQKGRMHKVEYLDTYGRVKTVVVDTYVALAMTRVPRDARRPGITGRPKIHSNDQFIKAVSIGNLLKQDAHEQASRRRRNGREPQDNSLQSVIRRASNTAGFWSRRQRTKNQYRLARIGSGAAQ